MNTTIKQVGNINDLTTCTVSPSLYNISKRNKAVEMLIYNMNTTIRQVGNINDFITI